jgi:hypothetical protein
MKIIFILSSISFLVCVILYISITPNLFYAAAIGNSPPSKANVGRPTNSGSGSGASKKCPPGQNRVNGVCRISGAGAGGAGSVGGGVGKKCPPGQNRVNGVCKSSTGGGVGAGSVGGNKGNKGSGNKGNTGGGNTGGGNTGGGNYVPAVPVNSGNPWDIAITDSNKLCLLYTSPSPRDH